MAALLFCRAFIFVLFLWPRSAFIDQKRLSEYFILLVQLPPYFYRLVLCLSVLLSCPVFPSPCNWTFVYWISIAISPPKSWLGHEDADADMPLRVEARLFSTPITRLIWLFLHPLIYAFRPFIKSPRPITVWELINFAVQITFDLILLHLLGFWAFCYLAFGTLLGLGPHPMTGHFISEHYLFADQQATHSYYGFWNPLIYNLGYHVEHHDFPYIAFTRLPKLHKIAPEYYENLPYHDSLCRVSGQIHISTLIKQALVMTTACTLWRCREITLKLPCKSTTSSFLIRHIYVHWKLCITSVVNRVEYCL